MNQTVDILCRARTLYASAPSHAPDHESPEPDTYCVVYALGSAEGGWECGLYFAAIGAFEAVIGTDEVVTWNAEHSTEEVLAAFDRAIAAQRLVVPELQRTEQRDPVHAGQEA